MLADGRDARRLAQPLDAEVCRYQYAEKREACQRAQRDVRPRRVGQRNYQRVRTAYKAGEHRKCVNAEARPRDLEHSRRYNVKAQQHDRRLEPEACGGGNGQSAQHTGQRELERYIAQQCQQPRTYFNAQ